MSDDGLQISTGGVVAVETDSLRHAAERFHAEARQLENLAGRLREQSARVAAVDDGWAHVAPGDGSLPPALGGWHGWMPERALALDARADAVASRADGIGGRLTHAAALYDVVEQRIAAEQAMLRGDRAAERAALARVDALVAEEPGLAQEADSLVGAWWDGQTTDLQDIVLKAAQDEMPVPVDLRFTPVFDDLMLLGATGAIAVQALGFGRMQPGTRGAAPGAVAVTQVGTASTGFAPRGLGDMLGRVPTGTNPAAVRVERYTMPDGSRRYTAYIRGTRNWRFTGTDPYNMASNVELYRRQSSTSYAAAQRALTLAGAKAGDTVDLVGHSQGGMIAGRLALDGGYRTGMLVTAGSPTEAQVPRDVLSVQLRHPDLVSNLAGGGSAARVGSEGSVVIQRDPRADGGPLDAHGLENYRETAKLADASADPQMASVRHAIDELGQATSVDVFEFDAEQPEPPKPPERPVSLPDPAAPGRPGEPGQGR